ncbi:MAG: methyltransferase domain-containing protein [Candidatus Omnitrophota bacterium]|nr:methyltransferase domain-containing protein [Candidatus Omnitrophota bacterium]
MWRKAREVILEGVHKDGTFLDVGCANGILLRDLCIWAQEKGITLIPFGIDISKELVGECKEKIPGFKMNFMVADKYKFKPKRKFTFICTSFDLRGKRGQEKYLKRYLDMLESGGRLILTRYDDQKDEFILLEEYLKQMGPKLDFLFVGSTEVHEITKVFWLEKMMDGKTFCLR